MILEGAAQPRAAPPMRRKGIERLRLASAGNCGSLAEMVLWWIKDRMQQAPEELDRYFRAVIAPILSDHDKASQSPVGAARPAVYSACVLLRGTCA